MKEAINIMLNLVENTKLLIKLIGINLKKKKINSLLRKDALNKKSNVLLVA